MNVEHLNKAFPRFPVTIKDKGWVYGVWYCGTSWQRVALHGQYPPTYLKRVLALFPDAHAILQCPSGTVTSPGICVDRIVDSVRHPTIQADASRLPFMDHAFDLVIADPPYTPADAVIYGTTPFPVGKAMKEFHRVLRPYGYCAFLHTYYPSFRRAQWKLVGLIAVVTGFCRATRMLSIFHRLP